MCLIFCFIWPGNWCFLIFIPLIFPFFSRILLQRKIVYTSSFYHTQPFQNLFPSGKNVLKKSKEEILKVKKKIS